MINNNFISKKPVKTHPTYFNMEIKDSTIVLNSTSNINMLKAKQLVTIDHNLVSDMFRENSPMVQDVKLINMSRGERVEAEIDWNKLKTLYVYDEMGNKIKFTDIFQHQKTIIIFTRHFLDFITKEYVEDIAIIPLEYIQNANVRLVVIGPAQPKHIKSFKKLTGLPYTLYVDPDRKVYKALGCQDKVVTAAVENSKHIKSGFVTGMLSSIWRAMLSPDKEFQGDVNQQGGAFILGPGEVCHFNHIDQNSADHCPLNDLLSRANVVNVSFPRDPRIQIV